jgi:hypothetical protein
MSKRLDNIVAMIMTVGRWIQRKATFQTRLLVVDMLLCAYVTVTLINGLSGIAKYVWKYYTDDDARLPLSLLLLSVLLYIGALYGLPYWLLLQYRAMTTRQKLQNERDNIAKRRDTVTNTFLANDNVITIFFPDVYEDDLSVCAYTGPFGTTAIGRGSARHLEAASIIATAHIECAPRSARSAHIAPFPELRVEAFGQKASFTRRILAWLSEQYYYLFRAQCRTNSRSLYFHRDVDINFAQEPDVQHGLSVVRHVVSSDPTPHKTAFVLFGVGRGANVAVEVMARLSADERHRIKGVVLEGLVTNADRIFAVSRAYRKQHPTELLHDPVAVVASFPPNKGTKYLIVMSLADNKVDDEQMFTFHRYLQAQQAESTLVILKNSRSGHYTTDNVTDVILYEEEALEFYSSL